STIQFINDASTNTVQYCTLKGSTTDAAAGVLFFSTTTGTTGNDDNTIDNNNITNSTDLNRPLNTVYSAGTSAKTNSGNTISNNNIYNFLNRGTLSFAIQLNTYNTGWAISSNSFYETASFSPTASVEYDIILLNTTTTTDIAINGNFIGGSAPLCGGTAWTKSGASYTNVFQGIFSRVGPTVNTPTSIQGNTIKNFAWSDAGASSWAAIRDYTGSTGDINIGTVTGNTIGATTGTGSITVTAGTLDGYVYGVYLQGTGTVDCQNNTIGSITAANVSNSNPTHFLGIVKTNVAGALTVSNNLIGSTTTANSIITSSASGSYPQYCFPINCTGTGIQTISGNTISNIKNSTTNTTTTDPGRVVGIFAGYGTLSITNNTIKDLTIANANTAVEYTASVIGIALASAPATAQTVSGNTISNLSNTYTSFAGSVTGIYYAGPATASTVSGNFIHSLTVSSNTAAKITGIYISAGTTTYSNNIVSLGGNTNSFLRGIWEAGGTNNKYYFNTVYIGGFPTSGSSVSIGLYSASPSGTVRNYRNNLSINTRSNNGASASHYGIVWDQFTGATVDYNNYVASGNGGVLGFYLAQKTTLADIQALGQDAHSISTDPLFASAGGTTAASYIPASVALVGVSGAGIPTTDYAGTTRTYNSMGAYDNPVSGLVTVTATVGTATGTYTSLKAAFDAINGGTHKGVIAVKLNGSTSESASCVLNASAATEASNPFYTAINVYPTVSGLSITGNLPSPLIDLNGADNVTIDGRVNATGSTKDLIITNTSVVATAGTSTIRFYNDASTNTVKYCTLKGSTTDAAAGVLFFSTTTGANGNDGNTID
ncbi:MAG: beta strand repeat-containing protein, partial [Bacteroidales bacterium]